MWRYDKPTKPGYYWCTLVAELKSGKIVAYGSNREFTDTTNITDNYRMQGEPVTGLGWVRDDDGYRSEKVWAWSEDEIKGVSDKLPEEAIVVEIVNRWE